MSELSAPHTLPEYSPSTGTFKITLRLPGTGAALTSATNAAASTPVKGGSVMLRVPGLPKNAKVATATKVAEPETPTPAPSTITRSRTAKEEAVATELTPVQPTPSTSKTTPSTTITVTAAQPAHTVSTTATGQPPLHHPPPNMPPPPPLTPSRRSYPPTSSPDTQVGGDGVRSNVILICSRLLRLNHSLHFDPL